MPLPVRFRPVSHAGMIRSSALSQVRASRAARAAARRSRVAAAQDWAFRQPWARKEPPHWFCPAADPLGQMPPPPPRPSYLFALSWVVGGLCLSVRSLCPRAVGSLVRGCSVQLLIWYESALRAALWLVAVHRWPRAVCLVMAWVFSDWAPVPFLFPHGAEDFPGPLQVHPQQTWVFYRARRSLLYSAVLPICWSLVAAPVQLLALACTVLAHGTPHLRNSASFLCAELPIFSLPRLVALDGLVSCACAAVVGPGVPV